MNDAINNVRRTPQFRYKALPYHGRLCLPANYKFNPIENELILASCLGDGSLLNSNSATPYPSSYRLVWNLGDEAHARFKQAAFSFLKCSLKEGCNPGWGSKWYQLATKYHPALNPYRPLLYNSKREPVATPEVLAQLGPIGWAWWYGDDGHRQDSIAFLHTEGYSEECNRNIAAALCRFTGVDNGVSLQTYLGGNPKKLRTMVRFKNEASKKFFQLVAPHMAPSMAYKISELYRP